MSRIAIIDFEASCLPDDGMSYPIEVALAEVDGPSRVWLIRPASRWRYWDWSEDAEQLHGLSLETIERDGLDVGTVAAELAEAARGLTVYADSELDAYWNETLAEAAGTKAFPILDIGAVFVSLGVSRGQVDAAEAQARALLPRQHQADFDARRWAETIRLLRAREAA
ncbi:hypothetical protein [Sphingomonas sp. ID0503]|uniref:hypothetical protein n=1 Tax=Sphingomonas sp. ID0503 TaxID=3399691 RepID=UPI003AFA561A